MLPIEILNEDILLEQRIKYRTGGAFWCAKEQEICVARVDLESRQFLQAVMQPTAFCANLLGLLRKPVFM